MTDHCPAFLLGQEKGSWSEGRAGASRDWDAQMVLSQQADQALPRWERGIRVYYVGCSVGWPQSS